MKCPTCHCTIHSMPQTWAVKCSACGKDKYPYQIEKPETGYVCTLCRVGSPRSEALRRSYREGTRVPPSSSEKRAARSRRTSQKGPPE